MICNALFYFFILHAAKQKDLHPASFIIEEAKIPNQSLLLYRLIKLLRNKK